jgi:TRAP-type C4-dicarboxylate transport system permease large subunit
VQAWGCLRRSPHCHHADDACPGPQARHPEARARRIAKFCFCGFDLVPRSGFNLTGVHKGIESFVSAAGIPPLAVIFIMVLIYILLGCFLETISMMLITIPIFFPIVIGLGYDPVWFGLLVVIVAEVGLITPPIGINLFVIKSMALDIRIQSIFSGVVPFIVADLFRVTIIVQFPGIVLWLPGLLF